MSGQMGTANITGYTGPGACAVVIPSTLDSWTVTSIGWAAFQQKTLTSVIIPATVTAINSSAFYYCSSMTGVYFLGNPPSLGGDVFTGANSATVYRLPTATGWGSTFGGRSVVMLAAPAVTTGITSGITTAAATLQGTVNPNGSASTAQFEYGPTNAYGSTATVTLSPNNGPSALPVSATLIGLPSGTHYHYRLTASNSYGAGTGSDASFTTVAAVPEIAVEQQPAGTNLIGGSANIGFGSVNIGSPSSPITFTVKNLGTATLTLTNPITKTGTHAEDFIVSDLGSTSVLANGSTTFSVTFSPSANGTRSAAIRIVSNDADENPFDISLNGTGIGMPPVATTGGSGAITSSTATLYGTVNPNGFSSTARFEYGTTTEYGMWAYVTLEPSNGLLVQNVSATLGELQQGKTYHYRLTATNSLGTSLGDDATFVTLNPDITFPDVAITYPVSNGATVDSSSLSVRGTASDNIGVTAVYLRVGEAPWAAADGTTSWSGTVTLATGLNTIQMYAEDSADNHSNIVSRTVTYTPEAYFAMQVAPGPMMVGGRMGANAEVMPDGKLVVFGGHGPPGWTALTTSENLLPGAGSFTQSTTVYSHDGGFFAKMLDGRFLIGGGSSGAGVPTYKTTEIYDPSSNSYTASGSTLRIHANAGAACLSTGKVLVVGAWYVSDASTYAELFNPSTGEFTVTGPLTQPRSGPRVFPASDGRAIVVGGMGYTGASIEPTPEIYDSVSNAFTKVRTELFPGETGWKITYDSTSVGAMKMQDGRYLFSAYRASGANNEYALAVFDPSTLAISKLSMSASIILSNTIGAYQPVQDVEHNRAYMLTYQYPDALNRLVLTLYAINLADGNVTSQSVTVNNPGYYVSASSVNILTDGELIIIGGTSNGSNFNAVANTVIVTYKAHPNTPPTTGELADITIDEDTPTAVLPVTIGDGETAASALVLTAESSNTALVPVSNIIFGGSGANRTVTVTPVANQYGSTTITVTVSDGTDTTSETFFLTVNSVNDLPTISELANTTIDEDTSTSALPMTIGDVETAADDLVLTAQSSNTMLVPVSNIIFGGSGANRTVTVPLVANQYGSTTITVTVSDGTDTTSESFLLTVNSVNDLPTLSELADITINEDTATSALPMIIGDVETAADDLVLTAQSSNTMLVPVSNIIFGGSGANRTVTVTPVANGYGSSTITMTVSDGTDTTSESFLLKVNSVNDLPTISELANTTIDEDTPTPAISISIGDVETPASALILSAQSSDTTLVPVSHIVFGGSGASRTVNVTPAANQYGEATITVTVSDGTDTTSGSFLLTVNSVNDLPTLCELADITIDEDTATSALPMTIGDVETAAGDLVLTAQSSDTTLAPVSSIIFGGSGANRTVTVTPVANGYGEATITVTVSDGTDTTSESFLLKVNSVNDLPTISELAATTIDEDTATPALACTIGDVESAASALILTAQSCDTALVPVSHIVFGGSGANRTVTVTPAANQYGSTTITVTVSDGSATTSETFLLTVNSVNDLPTLSELADITIDEDTSTPARGFTIGDVETAASELVLAPQSSNTTLVPISNIVFGGSGANRTVTVTPAADEYGEATITVTVSDGSATTSETFLLTVNPPKPDLVVSSMTFPNSTFSGREFQVSWTVTNEGHATASGPWSDQIVLSADSQIGGDILLGNYFFTGTILPGKSVTHTQTVSTAVDLIGNFYLIASANNDHQIIERNLENNSSVSDTTLDVAAAPIITRFSWNDSPIDNAATFTDKGTFSVEATDNHDIASAEFYYKHSGSSANWLVGQDSTPESGLSATWDISTVADGAYIVTARVYDSEGVWSEMSRAIDVALALPAAPVIIFPASGLTVKEPVTLLNITAQPEVSIHLYRDDQLLVTAYTADDGTLSYSAALPAGPSVFKAVAENRAGLSSDSNAVTVNFSREFPQLALTFDGNTVTEDVSIIGTVEIPLAETQDLTVQISTNKGSQMMPVSPVLIRAGDTSATFNLAARQDTEIELLSNVIVTAAAVEHRSAEAEIFLGDDDYPALNLMIDTSSVSETQGTVVGVFRRSPLSDRNVRVTLHNSNPEKVSTPEFVDIPANQSDVSFSITILNNSVIDGNQMIQLYGTVMVGDTSVAQSPEVELEVRDDDGPMLTLDISNSFIAEGASVNATVSRGGTSNTEPLLITLSQVTDEQLTIPATVTIPAGASQIPIIIAANHNAAVNGTRNVILRTTATGFSDGLSQLTLTDEVKAELIASDLGAPSAALTESTITVSYRVSNHGTAPANGPFFENIILSKDMSLSSDDILVRQLEWTGEVVAGDHYDRNASILMPRTIGTYYLIVMLDPGRMVPELNEANNTSVLLQPIEVRAAYSATVQAAAEIFPTNTPIVFTGSATREDSSPAAFSMVNISIKLNDSNRMISAITNAAGQFSTTWMPLPNEGGIYTIGAAHPGTPASTAQDSFEILTLGVEAPPAVNMFETESVIVQATLRNPNDRDLNGLAMTLGGVPAGLVITPNLPTTTLASGASMQVPITVAANSGFSGSGSFPLTVTTTEGVTIKVLVYVNVSYLTPSLAFSVDSLDDSALRGGSKSVSFTITNHGGYETGPVQVLLPLLSWMSLACASPLPSIPPGGSADVSLLLVPDASVPLTLYTGSIAINPANGGGRSLGYQFRVVSSLKGDLALGVVDELTFFTAAAPKLAGAQVVVRDAVTSAQVASITTGANGVATFTDLAEGWYNIDVSSTDHDSFSGNYYVNSGKTNTEQVFISKHLVKYSWKVEEATIADVYRVTLETKFETNVPAPVVTASPSTIDVADLVLLGQSMTVNITLENHGFIAAQNCNFRFSEHPFYSFTPLVASIGSLAAKSSMVVPVTVRRIGVFGDNGEIVTEASAQRASSAMRSLAATPSLSAAAPSIPCSAAGALDYNYPCGEWMIEKAAVIAVTSVIGDCGGGPDISPVTSPEYIEQLSEFIDFRFSLGTGSGSNGDGGFSGGGSRAGQDANRGRTSSNTVSFKAIDPCLPVCLARATVDCYIGFTAYGCYYSIAQALTASPLDQSNPDAVWAWIIDKSFMSADCLTTGLPINKVINAGACIWYFVKCYRDPKSGGPGIKVTSKADARKALALGDEGFVLDADFRAYAPATGEAWSRCEPVLRMYELYYGCKELVLAQSTAKGSRAMEEFAAAMRVGSPGDMMITEDESIAIEALSLDAGIESALVQRAIARWNRTQDYQARHIMEIADVPAGESTDFIDFTAMRLIAAEIVAAYDTSRAKGFVEPFDEFLSESTNLRNSLQGNQGGTCATIKIKLSQDVVMTRIAFRATLELENSGTGGDLTQVGFDMEIRDEMGQPSEDLFNTQVTQLTGLAAIDGTGEIPESLTGSVQWTLIPRDTAAQEDIRRYTVGGIIHYTQNGTQFNIPVENVPITVRPDASLALKYFHQRDVLGDDPHTDAIEPSIPYKLAVMVENNGHGDAKNLRIISGQPQIVDNEKGLLIAFKIIGTEVNGTPMSPSLTADFGTVLPGERKIATWSMTSTLQGLFTDYQATFEHITSLGDSRISLLENVEIHEMIRIVQAQGALDDGAPDFLTNDVNDVSDYPDTLHFSNGGTALVTLRQAGTFSGTPSADALTITLDTGAFSGWSYIRLPDPANAGYHLVSVTRGDGRVLPMDFNVWQSDRTFTGGGRRPVYEEILHLVDNDSPGTYTLVYAPVAPSDIIPPNSVVADLPSSSSINIPVIWSGTDNQAVSYYDVYVSVNDGEFSLWQQHTAELGALFVGSVGNNYRFYSIATDSAGNSEIKPAVAEGSTQVTVENAAPVIEVIEDSTVNEGDEFTLQTVAIDPDGPSSSIRFSIESDRAGVVIDSVTGIIRWNTGETDGGTVAHVTVVATDSGFPVAEDTKDFTITVNDVNSSPILTQVNPQTLASNGVLIVDADATDGDSPIQSLSYSLSEFPEGATIDSNSGVIRWAPDGSQASHNHLFTVTATDNGSPQRSSNMSFSVTVLNPPDQAPVFTQVPVVLWLKGKTYSLTVSASDPDGDAISLTANTSSAAGAVFDDKGDGSGSLSWNTSGADTTSYQIPVTAMANGATTYATLRIKVEKDELYWQWAKDAFGDLPPDYDFSRMNLDADPDGDGRSNAHEMAFLTDPSSADTVPIKINISFEDPFGYVRLSMHRRVGSDAYMDFDIASSENLSGPWQRASRLDWSAFADQAGDDDGRKETEAVDFDLFELYPSGVPARKFYRIEATRK